MTRCWDIYLKEGGSSHQHKSSEPQIYLHGGTAFSLSSSYNFHLHCTLDSVIMDIEKLHQDILAGLCDDPVANAHKNDGPKSWVEDRQERLPSFRWKNTRSWHPRTPSQGPSIQSWSHSIRSLQSKQNSWTHQKSICLARSLNLHQGLLQLLCTVYALQSSMAHTLWVAQTTPCFGASMEFNINGFHRTASKILRLHSHIGRSRQTFQARYLHFNLQYHNLCSASGIVHHACLLQAQCSKSCSLRSGFRVHISLL